MKRSRSGILTAQLLGCAVVFLGLIGASTSPAGAADDPRDAVAACVRALPQRPTPDTTAGCMRQSGYDPAAQGGATAVECIDERFPGGDLPGCLDDLAEPATPSPAQAGGAGAAGAAGGAAAGAAAGGAAPAATERQNAQAPLPGPSENLPLGAATPPPAAVQAQPAGAAAPAETPTPTIIYATPTGDLPWWPLAVAFVLGALMAAAITYFAIRTERAPPVEGGVLPLADGTLPLAVRIATPNDFSVHAAGTPIALSANVVPPERASDVMWTIVSPENRTMASGIGAQFTFSASFTGVYHVVARLDNAADDLLLLIYKTPSGGTKLTDLMQAEPPPFPRDPTSFVWNRARTL